MDRGLNIPLVGDILVRKVVAFREDDLIVDMVHVFNDYRISSAPVVNANNDVIGFVTDGDAMKSMCHCLFFDEYQKTKVGSIMSKNVLQVELDWDIFELDNFFITNKIHSAPVVSSDLCLLGIVTRRDALKALEVMMMERSTYKRELKVPLELSLYQMIKVKLDNHLIY